MSAERRPAEVEILIASYCDDVASIADLLRATIEQAGAAGVTFRASRPQFDQVLAAVRQLAATIESLPTDGPPAVDDDRLSIYAAAQWGLPTDGADHSAEDDPASTAPDPEASDPGAPDPRAPDPDTPDPNAPVHFEPRRPAAYNPRLVTDGQPSERVLATPIAEDGQAELMAALRGNTTSLPLTSVFRMLERSRKTGVLTVNLASEAIVFEFVDGFVQACASDASPPGERLGDLIASGDAIDPGLLSQLVADSQGRSKLPLGELLIRHGVATNGQIQQALERQLHLRFARACTADSALYEFHECDLPPSDGRMRIAPMELIYELERQ